MRHAMRNDWRCLVLGIALLGAPSAAAPRASAAEVERIGDRRELFVDRHMIDATDGVELRLHKPMPQEVSLVTDKPWEGNTCAYYTIFQDGDRYRMYYRGSHWDEIAKKAAHREVTCYAESRDGIHWTKPELGLIEWEGSQANNIVLDGLGTHCFVAFRDDHPKCPPEARYKGISRGRPVGKKGLYVFQSPDGLRWRLMRDEPVITDGAFDSQNLAFWDPLSGLYVDYHRTFASGVRSILTCSSPDFVTWSRPQPLVYSDTVKQHLYTNAIRPCPGAPHIRIGFPTRYLPREGSQVEPIFMASRNGVDFHRWNEAVIPRTAPKDRDGNRSNYMANGVVTTGNGSEYSVYASEAYYTGPDSRLRRFTYRVDGFVSAHARATGTLTTRPFRFEGNTLTLNFATQPRGRVRVELQDSSGTPIEGCRLKQCDPLRGDEIRQNVTWRGKSFPAAAASQPVRLKLEIADGDVYAFQFRK